MEMNVGDEGNVKPVAAYLFCDYGESLGGPYVLGGNSDDLATCFCKFYGLA